MSFLRVFALLLTHGLLVLLRVVVTSGCIQAKYDFIDEMLKWSGAKQPKKILDVGCGIGGTSRRLAAAFPDAEVIGKDLTSHLFRIRQQPGGFDGKVHLGLLMSFSSPSGCYSVTELGVKVVMR